MLPQASPAALDAAGRVSFPPGDAFFLEDFFGSLVRSVVSMVLRFSGLDARDEVFAVEDFAAEPSGGVGSVGGDEFECETARTGEPFVPLCNTGSELGCFGRAGRGGGLDRSR